VHLIQEIGSYAGFAAVVGLAVLSALYFSQARDVKRLRDWAGRAPERAAEAEAGGRPQTIAAQRVEREPAPAAGSPSPAVAKAKPATATPDAKPGEQPKKVPAAAPAAAAAKAAAPATAKAPAPASAAAAGPATAVAASAGPATKPADTGNGAAEESKAPMPAASTPAAGATVQRKPTPARPAAAPGGNSASGAKVLPARPVSPRPTPSLPRRDGSQTEIMAAPPGRRRERRWPAPRYLALIVAGVLVLGLGGTVGVLALTGGKKKASSAGGASAPTAKATRPGKHHRKKSSAPAIDPSKVTVAVLNGTNVPGLAANIGQKIRSGGFQLGNVTNASQQQRTESVVMYTAGQSRAARAVARKLGISQIEAIDTQTAALAGAATTVVVVGADKSHP